MYMVNLRTPGLQETSNIWILMDVAGPCSPLSVVAVVAVLRAVDAEAMQAENRIHFEYALAVLRYEQLLAALSPVHYANAACITPSCSPT